MKLLWLLILICTISNAQTNSDYKKILHFPTKGIYQKKNELEKLSNNSILIKYYDRDSTVFGYLSAQNGNGIYQLSPEGTKKEFIDLLFKQISNYSYDIKNPNIVCTLNKLSISSDSSSSNIFLHLKSDLYYKIEMNYRLGMSIDTVFLAEGTDSVACLQAIVNSIDYLCQKANTIKTPFVQNIPNLSKNIQVNDGTFSISAIDSISIIHSTILDDISSQISKGIFMNFQEFLSNAPSITNSFWLSPDTTSTNGNVALYVMKGDSSISKVNSAWGLSLGGNEIYMFNHATQLIPIEKTSNGIVLSRYVDFKVRKNQAIYWRATIGRGWPQDANPYERKRSISISSMNGKLLPSTSHPIATKIDIATGLLSF
ncbi:hypothetical protein [Rhizosphaericola mali]|uniref:Uncharacterized protein n=1 Tax=Rhizosphaericola mali TaxID=2545455 RepID=A0A5P2FYQ9_9BACT|nr:hypothetical protein [Rhizosphaericola mali]QES88067.1 hypothetical protein E0W69_005105 [Rhizosphaericola mali]